MPTTPQSPVSVNGIFASDANLSTTDITTNNASSTKHGFMPKLDNTATHFIDMTGTQRVLAASDFPAGTLVQVVNTTSNAVATGTTIIPIDDTIPQNTEGDQYMTLAITPKSTTNTLVIHATVMLSSSVSTSLIAALFQDTTANAIATNLQFQLTATGVMTVPLTHTMAAGTTSATTFKIRAGAANAGTTTFNGSGAGRLFGAIVKSSIVIMEYVS